MWTSRAVDIRPGVEQTGRPPPAVDDRHRKGGTLSAGIVRRKRSGRGRSAPPKPAATGAVVGKPASSSATTASRSP